MNFQKKYSREKFSGFLRDKFLPNDFRIKEEKLKIPFKSTLVENVVKLGEINSLNLKVYEIQHKSEHDPRVTLTREAFRLMANYGTRKALAAFISKSSPNYRFSLITVDLDLKGRKVTKEYSSPKRYSFYLGPDAKTHTPERFLVKKGRVEDFEDLASRFNVEIVTKEFFDKYTDLFGRLSKYLKKDKAFQVFAKKSKIDTDNFAKKLLGQVVFLYFLQRKGWLGAKKGESISSGDKNFLRILFNRNKKEEHDFFNDYLEPLFYNALNTKTEKAGSFYREYFDCQIPFLNGGLFEPLENYDWEKEHLHIPSKIFSSDPENPEKGDGILDIFDLYNFTVYESDPIDKEVSIDPEMLGKVFENLLEENLRKRKGTYYTPREIVHYMCQESLINYLINSGMSRFKVNIRNLVHFGNFHPNESPRAVILPAETSEKLDNLLKNIKIVDPACGSGAFLVGMLQEIVKARLYLSYLRNEKTNEYGLKKETIQNCIYGVDIDPGAVEIARLRLWLSLVVDYELEDIEPLPNLDYKIMQGNSLLEELVIGDASIKLFDSSLIKKASGSERMKNLFEKENQQGLFDGEKDGILKELKRLQLKYYDASDIEEKRSLREKIDEIEHSLIEESVKQELRNLRSQRVNIKSMPEIGLTDKDVKKLQKISSKEERVISILEEVQKSGTKPFFLWKLNFSEVFERNGGFDVVIGNPPYLSAVQDSKSKSSLRETYRKKYPLIKGAFDIYVVFLIRGVELLNDTGLFSWIVPNKLLVAQYAEEALDFLKENGLNTVISVSSIKVFEAGVYPILILGNKLTSAFNLLEVDSLEDLQIRVFKKRVSLDNKYVTFKEAGIKIASGATGFQAKALTKYLSENSSKSAIPFVVSGSINPYEIDFNNVRYMNRNYKRAFISKGKEIADSKWNFWLKEKIVIAGMTKRIEATYTKNSLALGVGVYAIYEYGGYNPKFLLGLLNSKFMTFFLTNKFKEKHLAGGYLAINKYALEKLPIAEAERSTEAACVKSVEKILKITSVENYESDSAKRALIRENEKQIDQIVYKVYDLTQKEIKIVEKS